MVVGNIAAPTPMATRRRGLANSGEDTTMAAQRRRAATRRRASPLEIARWCARAGWPVFPLTPGGKRPLPLCEDCKAPGHSHEGCPCITAGRTCHGFYAATLDAGRIARWWAEKPRAGVGVATGPADLVVLDIDARPGPAPERDRLLPGISLPDGAAEGIDNGFAALAMLARLRGAPDPAHDESTLRVRTPSGGMHVYFQAQGGPWTISAGSLAWQVDVRARGGYIIAPGTRTRRGVYTRIGPATRPAPLPDWLVSELERTGHHDVPPPAVPRRLVRRPARAGNTSAERAFATVLEEVAATAAVPHGAGFAAKLNRAAFTLGGLAAGGFLDEESAVEELRRAANSARPGQERRIEGIMRAGLEAGRRRPFR